MPSGKFPTIPLGNVHSTEAGPSVPKPVASAPAMPSAPAVPIPAQTEEILAAKQALATVSKSDRPTPILKAASRVLALAPDDEPTRTLVTKIIHEETRRQLDSRGTEPLIPAESWTHWEQLQFPEAQILSALQAWPTKPTDAEAELKILSEAGSTTATLLLGQLAATDKATEADPTKAFQYFLHAAARNDPAGDYLVGECYLFGKGTPGDPAAAMPYLQRAARAGEGRAMDHLGNCYYKGVGVERNLKTALDWFDRAISAHNYNSIANLAVFYLNGEGMPKNVRKGMELLIEGDDHNDPASSYQLARLQEHDEAPDLDRVRYYYQRAADAGHSAARQWLANHRTPVNAKTTP
jgi:TPR repeat protein